MQADVSRASGAGARLAAGVAVAVLALHALWLAREQGSACIDDAYISFEYAKNLVDGHGLVFNPGERVEGYTNFAWVLLLAGVYAVGADLELFSRLLAFASAAGVVGYVAAWSTRRFGAALGLVVGLALALDGSLARWAQDGLETSLFTLFVTLGALRRFDELDSPRSKHAGVVSSLFFVGAALVRPEGVLWFALSWTFGWLRPGTWRERVSRAAVEAGAFVVPIAAHVAWRLSYYGMPLPNTFYAKVGATTAQLERGLEYVGTYWGLHRSGLVAALALATALSVKRRWAPADLYLGACAAAIAAYAAAVGGDWMGPGRFLTPALPVALVFAASRSARWMQGAPAAGKTSPEDMPEEPDAAPAQARGATAACVHRGRARAGRAGRGDQPHGGGAEHRDGAPATRVEARARGDSRARSAR